MAQKKEKSIGTDLHIFFFCFLSYKHLNFTFGLTSIMS